MLERGQHLASSGFKGTVNTLGDFRKFILRGNVVDLAVGVVIGAAFNGLVQSFVKDLITPLIGLAGIPDFSKLAVPITLAGKTNTFLVGDFVNVLLSFLITAFIVYFFVVKPVNTLMSLHKRREEPVTTRECPFCVSQIPIRASRCPECTSQIPPNDPVLANAMAESPAR